MVDIICECGICRYSEYNKCKNKKLNKEFHSISTVDKVYINSSNCLEFSEERSTHDVE